MTKMSNTSAKEPEEFLANAVEKIDTIFDGIKLTYQITITLNLEVSQCEASGLQ